MTKGIKSVTLLNASILLSVPFVMLSTQVQASDLLEKQVKKCDGLMRDGIIHEDRKNGIINSFPEKICAKKIKIAETKKETAEIEKRIAERKVRIAEGRKDIAELKKEGLRLDKESVKLDKESVKLIKLLALLSPTKLKEHFIRMQDKITKEKDAHRKETLKKQLNLLKREASKVLKKRD